MKEYEVAGGAFPTPEQGKITLPPERCGRKDIEAGEIVISVGILPAELTKRAKAKREQGITEITVAALQGKTTRVDEGR